MEPGQMELQRVSGEMIVGREVEDSGVTVLSVQPLPNGSRKLRHVYFAAQ